MINNVMSFPEQALRDKLARQKFWPVMKSSINPKTKDFTFEIMVNCNESRIETISYEEACSMQGWKSFKLSENMQTVYPVIDKVAFKNDIECIEQCSKNRTNIADESESKIKTVWKFR